MALQKLPRNIMAGAAGQSPMHPATPAKKVGRTIIKPMTAPKGNTN